MCISFQDCSKRSVCCCVITEKAKLHDSSNYLHSLKHKGCIQCVVWVTEPNRTFKRLFVPGRENRSYLGLTNTSGCHKSFQDPGYCLSKSSQSAFEVRSLTKLGTSSARVQKHRAIASPDLLIV